MCGIVINPQKVRANESRRYDRNVFLVFPPNHQSEDHSDPSEWDITVPEEEESATPASAAPSSNEETPIKPADEKEEQPSSNPSSPVTTDGNQQQPDNQSDKQAAASSDNTSDKSPTRKGKKETRVKKLASKKSNKKHRTKAAKPASGEEKAQAVKPLLSNKVQFDLPNSSIGKKVHFAMDRVARLAKSSGSSSSSSHSPSSSISGSNDSFVDSTPPNVLIDNKSNGHYKPIASTSMLPPNIKAESLPHPRRAPAPNPIRKADDWKVGSPHSQNAPQAAKKATSRSRPSIPFRYAPDDDDDDDLDSELGSSIDRGSAAPSSRQRLREFHTGQNTSCNGGSLAYAPSVADSDPASDQASNVDPVEKHGPKPSWYRTPSPWEPPSTPDDPNEEGDFDPALGITWRDV